MISKVEINLNIVPTNTYSQIFKKSESKMSITEKPIIKDITIATESFSLS